jgi:uncharacterized OB-fold protein
MNTYAKPRPRVGPDSAPFWQGCREHRLLLPTCRACGKAHLPPGPACPFCFAEEIAWQEASGHGHVSTWTKVHKAWFPAFAEETPYTVVQVELDEVTSRLVAPGNKPIAIGQRVEVTFTDIDDDLTLHGFRVIE